MGTMARMFEKKNLAIVGGVMVIVAIILSGFWIWDSNRTTSPTKTLAASTNSDANNQQTTTGDNSTVQPGLQPSDSSPNQSNPQPAPSQSSAASLLDPSTFAKYDQYKDSASALYVDLQTGTGDELTAGKQAAVYYKGWLTNGTVFDQSQKGSDGNLQAFSFTLGQHQVIEGWEQGMAGMKVGSVRLLIVPPAVGYGASGQGPIPGNSVLVFQVQLAAVK